MNNSQGEQQVIARVQKEIFAYLNAKPDNRATAKELIGHITCDANMLVLSMKLLQKQGFIEGPVFTEAMIAAGGESNFRNSIQLTALGQAKYIEIIRYEQ